MTLHDRYCLPLVLDFACGLEPVRRQRDKIVALARGEVLESGIGSGYNLAHYDADHAHKIWALDPARQVHKRTTSASRVRGWTSSSCRCPHKPSRLTTRASGPWCSPTPGQLR